MGVRRIRLLILILSFLLPLSPIFASYGKKLCKMPGFYCLRVKGRQSWGSLFLNDHDRGIVMRINRMNTRLYPGIVLAVPKHLSEADIMDFAPFPTQIPSPSEKVVMVDPNEFAWAAYDATGHLVRWGPASCGADYCRDIQDECRTHAGSFRVYSLGDIDCYSTKFPLPDGGAPMPYCMYFQNGQALHGEPRGLPGHNASHGCVRMYVNDAEWLRYSFIEGPNSKNHYRGTKVIVKDYE